MDIQQIHGGKLGKSRNIQENRVRILDSHSLPTIVALILSAILVFIWNNRAEGERTAEQAGKYVLTNLINRLHV